MISQVIADANTWLTDASINAGNVGVWSEELAAPGAALDKALLGLMDIDAVGVVEKVNENKLAHDVEDLSAIFAQLEEGTVDFSLPCDDEDEEVVAAAENVHDDWIDELDQDAVNVEELSAAFDLLAEQVEHADDSEMADMGAEELEGSDEDSEDYDDEDDDDDDDALRIVPTAPAWVAGTPIDPRSVIQSTIFKNLDPRIPTVNIPRMDMGFGDAARCPPGPPMSTVSPRVAPCAAMSTTRSPRADKKNDVDEYVHDPATCWICKSDKTAFKKFALHRYLEKRRRRNWKRGPRYSGRSHVATNRVREGGRFVCTARWV